MIGLFSVFFFHGGLGAISPQNTKPEAELGVWRQTPCLLPAIFGLFVINLTLPQLQTHFHPPRNPGPAEIAPALLMQSKPG